MKRMRPLIWAIYLKKMCIKEAQLLVKAALGELPHFHKRSKSSFFQGIIICIMIYTAYIFIEVVKSYVYLVRKTLVRIKCWFLFWVAKAVFWQPPGAAIPGDRPREPGLRDLNPGSPTYQLVTGASSPLSISVSSLAKWDKRTQLKRL